MRSMKRRIALTLALSHPMGEGTGAGYFLIPEIILPASAHGSPKDWERFSLSLFGRERTGVRIS